MNREDIEKLVAEQMLRGMSKSCRPWVAEALGGDSVRSTTATQSDVLVVYADDAGSWPKELAKHLCWYKPALVNVDSWPFSISSKIVLVLLTQDFNAWWHDHGELLRQQGNFLVVPVYITTTKSGDSFLDARAGVPGAGVYPDTPIAQQRNPDDGLTKVTVAVRQVLSLVSGG